MLGTTGVGWVRNELEWVNIEATRGHYAWGVHDGAVLGWKRQGIKVLFISHGRCSHYVCPPPSAVFGTCSKVKDIHGL
jgi:hypothetical protein